jgi:hypothetical protein
VIVRGIAGSECDAVVRARRGAVSAPPLDDLEAAGGASGSRASV